MPRVCNECQERKSNREFLRSPESQVILPQCRVCTRRLKRADAAKKQAERRALARVRALGVLGGIDYELPQLHVLKRYGLTPESYHDLMVKQDYKCPLCDEVTPLVIDHDHVTNEVRGLLCQSHNRGLGYFGDSVEGLQAAIAYLSLNRS